MAPKIPEIRELFEWIHVHLDDAGISYKQLAGDLYHDPSWVSRILCTGTLPQWPLVEAVAKRSGESTDEAKKLWDAADAASVRDREQRAEGFPPPGMGCTRSLLKALRDLIETRVGSQRELIRRDQRAWLTRSMVGAMLRGDRSMPSYALRHIVDICGLEAEAKKAWLEAYSRSRPCRCGSGSCWEH
jgi:hypothetical protein